MTRLLTALALLALSFYLVFWAPNKVFIGAAVVTGFLCYREYAMIAAGHGIPKPGWLGVAGGTLILLLPQYALASVALILLLVTTIALRLDNLKDLLAHAAATIFGIFYTFAP